ncbi:virulence RhuM family protein [Actinomycetospora termitidis]|uniref:Virulence RhuM family protein n=1 Tax=Actinomycetospora termitidis TaxID=3053470 RepID=A0ABT7MHQ6_9PSEU|nr:virulence RhuM family protein [Actinomycetospora sp. Odt1-22]MDL5159719.1 virulence RhuM family protein [Actinomycetospora sp. Odt1-22]
MTEPSGEIVVYTTPDGGPKVQLRAVGGTAWLSQTEIAHLYGTSVQNIDQIARRVLGDGEVTAATVNSELRVALEGKRQVRRQVKVYNLDLILAIGYRVSTPRAVQFRQWATTVLREYLIKGFALDDPRLRDPAADYFDELLARIRDIRASEKRFYLKVRDLFAASSADYDGSTETARTFFATIQNKLVYAITGRTAAELVLERANPASPTMGLTTWDGERIRKSDVEISKNYLHEKEITQLNRLVTRFLDFAEDRAERRETILMQEWIAQTDRFLEFDEREVLDGPGRVSAERMRFEVGERYMAWDGQRRAREAERAAVEEENDLRELLALEQRCDPEDDGIP